MIPKPNKRHIHTHTCLVFTIFFFRKVPYPTNKRCLKKNRALHTDTWARTKTVLSPQPVSCSRQTISTLLLLTGPRYFLKSRDPPDQARLVFPCASWTRPKNEQILKLWSQPEKCLAIRIISLYFLMITKKFLKINKKRVYPLNPNVWFKKKILKTKSKTKKSFTKSLQIFHLMCLFRFFLIDSKFEMTFLVNSLEKKQRKFDNS